MEHEEDECQRIAHQQRVSDSGLVFQCTDRGKVCKTLMHFPHHTSVAQRPSASDCLHLPSHAANTNQGKAESKPCAPENIQGRVTLAASFVAFLHKKMCLRHNLAIIVKNEKRTRSPHIIIIINCGRVGLPSSAPTRGLVGSVGRSLPRPLQTAPAAPLQAH